MKYIAFFSSGSPFSNFHHTDFLDNNGKPFHCSEQKFNYDKAVEFNDMECAINIPLLLKAKDLGKMSLVSMKNTGTK